MTNSPAIFQTMMNNIFRDLIAEEIVVVYLDDILIFIRTVKQYTRAVQRVLEILVEHKLYLWLDWRALLYPSTRCQIGCSHC